MENYVSVNEIIEKVYRDNEYGHELDWGDAISWVGEVIGLIGAPAMFIEKTTGNSLLTPDITIVDYRGELPIDFHSILPGGVRDKDSGRVYDHATDKFHSRQRITKESAQNTTALLTFIIKDKYIDTNQLTGTIEMAYTAYKVDDDGFPMIPDNERVKKCVGAYITERIDHRLWRKNKISERVYRDSEKDYLWYIGSAQNIMHQMTPEQRHAWTQHWTRLLPVLNQKDFSYAYMNSSEDLNIGFNNV